MVTIQPFEYEKTTAFKERVQIANKVNEIINLFNELDIESKINEFNQEIVIINGKITEINNALNEVNSAVNTVEGYNTRLTSVENESSSNTAKIGVLENKDLENVKLSGNQTIENIKTFTSSPIVPNPPSGDTSTKAVNTNWISQTGDNAPNNLVHKSGTENVNGVKTFINGISLKNMNTSRDAIPTNYHDNEITHINDINGEYYVQFVLTSNVAQDPTKRAMFLQVRFYGKNGASSKLITIASGEVQGE